MRRGKDLGVLSRCQRGMSQTLFDGVDIVTRVSETLALHGGPRQVL
jgi:hypothetical protein